jgi:hypothetical protein
MDETLQRGHSPTRLGFSIPFKPSILCLNRLRNNGGFVFFDGSGEVCQEVIAAIES